MIKYIFSALFIAISWAVVLVFEQPVSYGWLATCFILFVLAAIVSFQWFRARKSARELESALKQQNAAAAASGRPDLQADIEAMEIEFANAVQALKGSTLGRKGGAQALYALPWYVIIGPPGAGKSTALRNSGLDFPYLSKRSRGGGIQGLGGTRNCEWWMTNQAVILDTAGRYTTSDNDRDEWFAFLEQLKQHRPKRPINGIMIAISVMDVCSGGEESALAQAREIRARIDEVIDRLQVSMPIYVLFTKCDLIPGFAEIFANLGKMERGQIWGFTRPLDQVATRMDDEFIGQFDQLYQVIQKQSLQRVGEERSIGAREQIFAFPQHFNLLRDNLATFIGALFAPNIYAEPPRMRGVYFTSGTQEGRPIDKIMGSIAQAFGLSLSPSAGEQVTESKSYFLSDLFTKIIFPDRGLSTRSAHFLRRRNRIQYAIAGVITICAITMAIFPVMAVRRNQKLVQETSHGVQQIEAHRIEKSGHPIRISRVESTYGLETRLDTFEQEGPPLTLRWGMYQGNTILPKLRTLNVDTVRRELLSPMLNLDAETLRRFSNRFLRSDSIPTEAEYKSAFTVLHRYLLLTGPRTGLEPALADQELAWLIESIAQAWYLPLTQLGETATREQMQTVSQAYLAKTADQEDYRLQRDKGLVESIQAILRRSNRGDAIIWQIVDEVDKHGFDIRIRDIAEATSIQNSNNQSVRGAFTRRGWEKLVRSRLEESVDGGGSQAWVLGRDEAGAKQERSEQIAALRSRYFDLYIREWQDFIGSIFVSAPSNYTDALAMMQALTRGATPPLASIFEHVSWNTHLYEAPPPKEKQIADEILEAGKEKLKKKAEKKLKRKLPKRPRRDEHGRATIFKVPADVAKAFDGFVRFGAIPAPPPNHDDEDEAKGPPVSRRSLPIDVYQEQLALVRDALRARQDNPSEEAKLVRTVKAARTRVQGLINEQTGTWRPRFDAILWPPFERITELAEGSERSSLDQNWCNEVVVPFVDSILNRYPFRKSGRDASLNDLNALFKPEQGKLWEFQQATLANRMFRQGDHFILAEQGEAAKWRLSNKLVTFYNRALDIQRVMYAPGSKQPAAEFDVWIVATSGIAEISLTIDEQRVVYRNGPESWKRMRWPGEGQQKGAALRVKGYGVNDNIEQSGEWGFFRLLEEGKVSGSAGQPVLTARWQLRDQAGKTVTIKIRPVSRKSPFFGIPGRSGGFLQLFRNSKLNIPRTIAAGSSTCRNYRGSDG